MYFRYFKPCCWEKFLIRNTKGPHHTLGSEMAQWKWWSWRILGRAKRKGVDLRLNAAIEIAPLNSLNVRKRFSFLLRLQQSFIAIKLETNYFDRKETSKNSKICRLLAKIFARWGRKQWLRSNVCAQKSSKHWLSRLFSLQVNSDANFYFSLSQSSRRRNGAEKKQTLDRPKALERV
ncbi:hypothetical protein KFK09_020472 [Dendrobium nobile]|uniref:Uncharacterized protein n=1 Tax=Dendrobium nobile TaxID=94219 RepID=A0A8T3ALF2_DENNO|nr:hypothetical protein KFK09_020472 [Dendrobium nobile]